MKPVMMNRLGGGGDVAPTNAGTGAPVVVFGGQGSAPTITIKRQGGPGVTPENPAERGDCLQAATASILEIALDEVPNFHLYGADWFKEYGKFLLSHGWRVEHQPLPLTKAKPAGYWIALLPSPSGVVDKHGKPALHCVVCKGDEVLHDPSPKDNRYRALPNIPMPGLVLTPIQ